MKHKSILHKLTAALLSCALCCTGMTVPAFSADETAELPAKFDLRDEGAMTPVKGQYGGTCCVYSSFAAIESNMILHGMADNSLDLSESHFSWFTFGKGSPDDPDDPLIGDGRELGLDGYKKSTNFIKLASTLASWKGVVYESETPENKAQVPFDESMRYASVAHLQDASVYPVSDPDTIKRKIMEKGGMHLAYFSIGKPEHYSEHGGYYQSEWDCNGGENNPTDLDGGLHALCLCGWDDNFPKEYFLETPPGDGAWICKNSWGPNTTAGVDGYTYISYYDQSIHDIVQYDMEPTDNYDRIYQYCGVIDAGYTVRNRGWSYANVYTADKDENLTAAAIYMNEGDLPYEICIYALNDGYESPRDGRLLAQISGTEPYRGYHTYPLHTACQVRAGQKFSVVVKTGIKEGTTLHFDKNGNGAGESYYTTHNQNGEGKWNDSTSKKDFGNPLAKVFTKDGTAVSEENYPDLLYRKAIADAYDKNGDFVITEKEFAEGEHYIRGDVNRDGKVNAVDLSLLKQVLLGSQRTDLCLIAGDWNGDEAINAEDVKGMLAFLLQKQES